MVHIRIVTQRLDGITIISMLFYCGLTTRHVLIAFKITTRKSDHGTTKNCVGKH